MVEDPKVFEEPGDAASGSTFTSLTDWLRHCGSLEAQAARADINAWYRTFPDRSDMLLSRLRGDSDLAIQQATDELYTYHLLSQSYDVRYEEDETSPDFRLYSSGDYRAGIEVLTLFSDQAFTSVQSRNAALVDEINQRVPAGHWWVGINIIDWRRQPRVAHLARWIETTMATLPRPSENMNSDDYPNATYSTHEVEIVFTFVPRGAPTISGPLVGIGPSVFGFVQSSRRLRRSLSQKIGRKYDHRGRPFAILASIRDVSCDTEEIVNALYGDSAIVFPANDPDMARPIRRGNGAFGRSASAPDGKNRRLSCVFALMRGWAPGSATNPTIVRYDNPFANDPFPENAFDPNSWLASEENGRLHWR